jgi:hypothetical protein
VGNIQIVYESENAGWKRITRVTDLKFQWVRLDGGENHAGGEGELENDTTLDLNAIKHFDFLKIVFVRKIYFLEGNDARMRTGYVDSVPASEAVVDSRLIIQNRTLISYADIASVQGKSLPEKCTWFRNICKQLTTSWEDGHIKIYARRSLLLIDTVEAIMGLSREDMRKQWRIEFMDEPDMVETGASAREWFTLVTEQIFDPAFGLWIPSIDDNTRVDINPASGKSLRLFVLIFHLATDFNQCLVFTFVIDSHVAPRRPLNLLSILRASDWSSLIRRVRHQRSDGSNDLQTPFGLANHH